MAYQGERSFSEVVESIVGNVQTIIRSEIHLAKTEVKEETAKAARASGILAAGGLLGLYAGGFLLLTIVRALENVTPPWLASLIVALIVGAIAGWLAGQVVSGAGFGLIGDIIVGIIGAIIAGLLFPRLGIALGGGILSAIIASAIGAIILLAIIKLVRRA